MKVINARQHQRRRRSVHRHLQRQSGRHRRRADRARQHHRRLEQWPAFIIVSNPKTTVNVVNNTAPVQGQSEVDQISFPGIPATSNAGVFFLNVGGGSGATAQTTKAIQYAVDFSAGTNNIRFFQPLADNIQAALDGVLVPAIPASPSRRPHRPAGATSAGRPLLSSNSPIRWPSRTFPRSRPSIPTNGGTVSITNVNTGLGSNADQILMLSTTPFTRTGNTAKLSNLITNLNSISNLAVPG